MSYLVVVLAIASLSACRVDATSRSLLVTGGQAAAPAPVWSFGALPPLIEPAVVEPPTAVAPVHAVAVGERRRR